MRFGSASALGKALVCDYCRPDVSAPTPLTRAQTLIPH